jgi:ATP-dependent DNA helicase Rep
MPALNPRQQEAVQYLDGPLLVLAGAGSGKTRVITEKIVNLVKECGVEPHQITAVTFTNKAAREMRSRVGKMLKNKEIDGIKISTFHTLGLNIIRREIKTLGYKPGFSIFDDQDTDNLLKELLRQDNIDDSLLSALRWRISDWKNSMLTPEQALEQAEDNMEQRGALLYGSYQRSLRAYNAVDFDDLILLPTQLFRDHAEVLDRWQNRIRYMLVCLDTHPPAYSECGFASDPEHLGVPETAELEVVSGHQNLPHCKRAGYAGRRHKAGLPVAPCCLLPVPMLALG